MGGIRLTVPAGAVSTAYAVLTLSEELTGPWGTGALLYPMRTGNHYRYTLTVDPKAHESVFELHEYALFRYGTIELCDALGNDGGCKGDSPPGPPPPSTHTYTGCAANAPENQAVTFECAHTGQVIRTIEFASYGTPAGNCTAAGGANSFAINPKCNADNTAKVLARKCVGQESCSFRITNGLFANCTGCLPDGDPCHHTTKYLDAAFTCGAVDIAGAGPGTAATRDGTAAWGAAQRHIQGRSLARARQAAAQSPPRAADRPVDTGTHTATGVAPFVVTAWVVRYPWSEDDSSFSCSNDLVNRCACVTKPQPSTTHAVSL